VIAASGPPTSDGQPVSATFSADHCSPEAWRGLTIIQGGRAMVSLRPASNPEAGADAVVRQSATLWLSADRCELGGVTKDGSDLRITVYRSTRCPAAKRLGGK
jgi:hypothetical protein